MSDISTAESAENAEVLKFRVQPSGCFLRFNICLTRCQDAVNDSNAFDNAINREGLTAEEQPEGWTLNFNFLKK
ncbi:MAG: hypothetical protein P9X24_12955 [Candidatus Hatepunaea meridiana]|nr:hypothetical protein [Candidatus Hatepunaea meridiana]